MMQTRYSRLWASSVLILSLVCAFAVLPGSANGLQRSRNASPVFSLIKNSSIILHNPTGQDLVYLIKPIYSTTTPERKILKPGMTEQFHDGTSYEIQILPEDSGLIFWLFPGENYAVRELEDGGQRIFKTAQGLTDTLDLAPYVPSPMPVVESMLEIAGVSEDSVVYDLGCGDGRVVVAAARIYRARGVGVDINPQRITEARENARIAGVENLVKFLQQDIFATDLSDATVVYMYLLPDSNRLLRPFLEERLKKGTTVVCLDFSMPGWRELLVTRHEIGEELGTAKTIYIYRL